MEAEIRGLTPRVVSVGVSHMVGVLLGEAIHHSIQLVDQYRQPYILPMVDQQVLAFRAARLWGPAMFSKTYLRSGYHQLRIRESDIWYMVSKDEIMVGTVKIAAVCDCARTTSSIEVHSFIGLAGYYRRFVEGFSSIVAPLTILTQKNVHFKWFDECESSFLKLKNLLTSALIFTLLVEG
ncbi:uncharacterized mitochondrial protein AtMg00860-like [Solanum dulcamara]|uniref:uncharacterized mitochondrial protein AtMg00860-like n=1 Tax=Solanum dulcamara TaxID=45834 RepID=UPI002486799D|nr:uncharacterized mitochondrial protein AtMg00860-like [Solanum dulcamara]